MPGADERLATLHLRTGSLALATAELEALASVAELSCPGLADLAEARWRSGNLEDAALAASGHLDAGGDLPIAHLILAEAGAAAGKADEAAVHAAVVEALPEAARSMLFSGMPHRANWAPENAGRGRAREGTGGGTMMEMPEAAPDTTGSRGRGRNARPTRPTAFPEAGDLLDRARDDMRSGDPERMSTAFDRLALALRLDAAMAPRIVELVARRQEPAALLVRGDAFRILGRILESEAAYAGASTALDGMSTHRP